MAQRKKYSKEYKLDAVSLVLEQNYTRTDVANSLEIRQAILGRWVSEHQQSDDGILCSRNEVKYSFITQNKNT